MSEAYTVSEITTYIRSLFEVDDRLGSLWVSGEVSNLSRAPSGHCYFTLKDSGAQLKCVMWRSQVEKQTALPKNGDAVVVHGYIGVYDANGVYQLYADAVRAIGVGDLYQRFEALKAQLQAEGLFDAERKRALPPFPLSIGVVTSPEAAAFQDVQQVLRRRFPLVRIVLSPTPVQGNDAPPRIAAAIDKLNRAVEFGITSVDVILVCRGGGSIEDLWAFNDERVARAIAASRLPVISGVGHETDFTIADFAADLRAPTPSAAAEILTPDIADLRAALNRTTAALDDAVGTALAEKRYLLEDATRALRRASPMTRIDRLRQRLDDWNVRMISAERGRLALLRERLSARRAALNAANPNAILARGYVLVTRSEDGARLTTAGKDAPTPGTGVTLRFHDGELKARIEDKDTHERYKRTLF